jgi:Yip1 domain
MEDRHHGLLMSALLNVFFSPGKAFDQVRERSLFLPGLIAAILLSIANFAVLANLVGMETMARKQLESSSRAASLTPEQKEQALSQAGTPARLYIGYGFAGAGAAIVWVAIAGISLGLLSAAGASVKFPQVLGATTYSAIPFLVLSIIMTAAILLASPERDSLDFTNLIATNIGAFLNKETTNKALYSIAGSIDLISFAHIAFMGFAYSRVSKLSFSACTMIVTGMWIVYVLGKAGLAMLF